MPPVLTAVAAFVLVAGLLSSPAGSLLDRVLFFGDPEISAAQLSPDGRHLAFIRPWQNTRNIWVKRAWEPFDAARLLTAHAGQPVQRYFWSRDSTHVVFAKDDGGDENYNIYAVNVSDAPQAGQAAARERPLTSVSGVRARIYHVPKTAPDILYVGLNDRDKAWHDLYEVSISTGVRRLVRKNTDRITGWFFDNEGRLRLVTRSDPSGATEILRPDETGFTTIYSCHVLETCTLTAFDPENRYAYLKTNKGDADLISLARLDPKTGVAEPIEADPLERVDLSRLIISERTDRVLATVYWDDKPRIYWRDPEWEADYNFLRRQLEGKEIHFASVAADERLMLVTAYADTEPGTTYLFDRSSKKLMLQYSDMEELPRRDLAAMTPVRYRSFDGLEIPAYLTLPKGRVPRNLPAVVLPHGGPWTRDWWGYSAMPQFLANRGYAVLQPNFRGSAGYGKAFLNAGDGQWGENMQADLTWGVKYLVSQGIADPGRIAIMGNSYGGYAALAGAAFTPDVYAAAVAVFAPSNLITLLQSVPPYWESMRALFYARMGDPRTPEGKARLERQSPLAAVDSIKTPLFVLHGANDPRVKKDEADQIVKALDTRGFPVEYLVAPDEGHGFARPVNRLAAFAAVEKFLATHLAGRYQKDLSPEVAVRLKEITVDPAALP